MQKKLAVIIPAHNEEKVLGNTLKKLVTIVNRKDIYLISDASTDKTDKIAKEYKINLIRNEVNLGKNKGIKVFFKESGVLEKYQFISILDADTIPHKNFYEKLLPHFKAKDVACVCGLVKSHDERNIFVAYRNIMYFIWQNIYKRIANLFNAVTIAPGTASIYRSSILKKIEVDEKLIIEDFDMTFQVHRKKLGRVIFEPKAIIITQDPDSLHDTLKQVTRWNTGFFQTAIKHKAPFGGQPFDIFIALTLLNELFHLFVLLFIPFVLFWLHFISLYPSVLGNYVIITALDLIILFEIFYAWTTGIILFVMTKKVHYALYGPLMWLIQYIYVLALFKALYKTFFEKAYGPWASPARR